MGGNLLSFSHTLYLLSYIYILSLYLGVQFSTFTAAQGIGAERHKSETKRHTAAESVTSGTKRHKVNV